MLDSKDVRRRLAFIRHLHRVAVQQSEQPEPLGAASVLTFHDAAEVFLHLAFEHLDVGGARPQFMEYWDRIATAKNPVQLSGKVSMGRLNQARVSLKHSGLLPSPADVEGFRATVTGFFEDNTPTVFDVAFDRISMVDLVMSAGVRDCLELAEAAIASGDTIGASRQLAIAFDKLLHEYDVMRDLIKHRPYAPNPSTSRFVTQSDDRRTREGEEERRWAADAVESLASAVRVLALGLDYRRFRRFRATTPQVDRRINGEYVTSYRASRLLAKEDCEEALAFVVDCALRVQQ